MQSKRIRLGILTPSSNTALEPITSAMLSALPHVSAHFARFTVTEISLTRQALGQFDVSRILDAAGQLADARVDVIGWSGTSAGWLGFERDEALCRQLTEATGIPATTSVLALNEILAKTGVRRLGLVSPYTDDVQAADHTQLREAWHRMRRGTASGPAARISALPKCRIRRWRT